MGKNQLNKLLVGKSQVGNNLKGNNPVDKCFLPRKVGKSKKYGKNQVIIIRVYISGEILSRCTFGETNFLLVSFFEF